MFHKVHLGSRANRSEKEAVEMVKGTFLKEEKKMSGMLKGELKKILLSFEMEEI